jgi:hypothetical protein
MQLALKAGGPIEAVIQVFDTFKAYHSGVYAHPEPPRCQDPSHLNCCLKYRYCIRYHKYKFNKTTKQMEKRVIEEKQKASGHAFIITGWGEFPANGVGAEEISKVVTGASARRLMQWQVDHAATAKYPTAGKKYWIAENSWGSTWADGGFFLIERGIDTVGIESMGAYTLQPGHKVLYKHNSRCKCNAHGDVVAKTLHISSGIEEQKKKDVCHCDTGWGGATCDTFCADSLAPNSHFCTKCTDTGLCTRCRVGVKAEEKQVLGAGRCWTKCIGKEAEELRMGGKCFSSDTYPCTNSKTQSYDYKLNGGKCVCESGYGGARCQYRAKCAALTGSACSACKNLADCATPQCRPESTVAEDAQKPGKCVSACSGHGFKVALRYATKCMCRDGYSGVDCSLDCGQSGSACLACSSDGVCLVKKEMHTIVAKEKKAGLHKMCIIGDGGKSVLRDSTLAMVKNNFMVSFWMQGSHWEDAQLFTWYGSGSDAITATDELNTGQVDVLERRKVLLSVRVSFFEKSPHGELHVVYGGGQTPLTFKATNKVLKEQGIFPGKWTHVAVVVHGLKRTLEIMVNFESAGTFSFPDYPAPTTNNQYVCAEGGFWGNLFSVSVANEASSIDKLRAAAPTKTTVESSCAPTCDSSCKGECLFGSCVCKLGFTGDACDEKAVLATFFSGMQRTNEIAAPPNGAAGYVLTVPVPVNLPSHVSCFYSAANVAQVRIILRQTDDVKIEKSCYHDQHGQQQCFVKSGALTLKGGMIQLTPPKGTAVSYLKDKELEYVYLSEAGNAKNLTISPDYRTAVAGVMPLIGSWTVAISEKQKAETAADFNVDKTWSMGAQVQILTSEACAKNAAETAAPTAASVSLPKVPTNLCVPNPCGPGGKCHVSTATNEHVCMCKDGWDKSVRDQHSGNDLTKAVCDFDACKGPGAQCEAEGAKCGRKWCGGSSTSPYNDNPVLGGGCFDCIRNVTCSKQGALRLVNKDTGLPVPIGHPHSEVTGRLDVCNDGQWGTVCDDQWNHAEHNGYVACSQLGYMQFVSFTNTGETPNAGGMKVWMDEIQCSGSESKLSDCPFPGWAKKDCRHKEDVVLTCHELQDVAK